MLRLAIAGSVDDGKSTLIGRLLLDSKSLFDDHNQKISELGEARGMDGADLAALTDGLKSEREQGITIDVAYRYFTTSRRRIVLIDTPGHEQYTRNMVTGASNANHSIVLVDASKGIKPQTSRHALIAVMLGHGHLIFAINKMDLIAFDKAGFEAIAKDCARLAARLGVRAQALPLAALTGDNVVTKGKHLDWYGGPSLFAAIEELPNLKTQTVGSGRMAVKWVHRIQGERGALMRGLTGIWSGKTLTQGDELYLYPGGMRTRAAALWRAGQEVECIHHSEDAMLLLADDLDSHSGQIVATGTMPQTKKQPELLLCWFDRQPGNKGQKLLAQHAGHRIKARLESIGREVLPQELTLGDTLPELEMNHIAQARLACATPLLLDSYREHQQTGSLILIDPESNTTLAAGINLRPEQIILEDGA